VVEKVDEEVDILLRVLPFVEEVLEVGVIDLAVVVLLD
jgi:hypothetical protein